MKKHILWGLFTCIVLASCYKEDALSPTEGGIELRFEVPQGNNSWDDDIKRFWGLLNLYRFKRCRF